MYSGFSESEDMRKRLFEIIEVSSDNDSMSTGYDVFMMLTIIVSIIPLAFKQTNSILNMFDKITVVIFIVDYVLRIITADYKMNKGIKSFILYPFSVMAIIDLIAILPSLTVINGGFRLLKVFRLLRTLRVFRVFKAIRYSTSIQMVLGVFKRTKESLLVVCGIAIMYVLVSALVVFNVEPDTFDNYFDAVYWATVSLTTMGYGDIYPVSVAGRLVTMISSFMGIAIIALPAGIITAGLMEEIDRENKEEKG